MAWTVYGPCRIRSAVRAYYYICRRVCVCIQSEYDSGVCFRLPGSISTDNNRLLTVKQVRESLSLSLSEYLSLSHCARARVCVKRVYVRVSDIFQVMNDCLFSRIASEHVLNEYPYLASI